MRYPKMDTHFSSLVLPCPTVRETFPHRAMEALKATQKIHRKILTPRIAESGLVQDPFGPFARLEALVYARAISKAIGSNVFLRLTPNKRPGDLSSSHQIRIIDPKSLYAEGLIADSLKDVGDDFLRQTNFMRFNAQYTEFLYLGLLYGDDVIISNSEK